jgi:hypothetical protein
MDNDSNNDDNTSEFKPDERQQKLINEALKYHREAQQSGRYAPERLVRKWSSEVGIDISQYDKKGNKK